MQSDRSIKSVQLEKSDHTVDPAEIKSSFKTFYESLHQSAYPEDTQLRSEFVCVYIHPPIHTHTYVHTYTYI